MLCKEKPGDRGAQFVRDESGNAFMIFGLAFVPAMLMVGATIDYTRLAVTRSALRQGTDAAVLSVASKINGTTTITEAKNRAQVVLNATPRLGAATVTDATLSADRLTFCIKTSVSIPSAIMQIAQINTLSAGVSSCANLAGNANPNATYEIALVLDNSGSMGESAGGVTKMQALKSAATNFINTMYSKSQNVAFSITPFAAGVVAVDPTVAANRTLSWIDTQGNNSQHWVAFGGKTAANAQGFASRFDIFTKLNAIKSSYDWKGCFEPPVDPRNVNDTPPTQTDAETLFVPYLAPDEPNSSKYGNSYIPDSGGACSAVSGDWNKLTNVCKYKAATSASGGSGPNWDLSRPLDADRAATLPFAVDGAWKDQSARREREHQSA